MRNILLTGCGFLSWIAWLPTAFGQQAGERVVVTSPMAEIRSGPDVIDSVSQGAVLEVREVRGDWLLVRSRKTGWLQKRHVVPLDKSVEFFTEAIRRNPKDTRAYAARGMAAVERSDYDAAIADFNEMIRLNPQDADAYKNRGLPWVFKGEFDKAIGDYTEAIRLNPKDVAAYYSRGNARQQKGDYDQAIGDFDAALRLDPRYAGAYYSRGIARHLKGAHDQAIPDFDRSIQLDPKYAGAFYHRGIAWEYKGEYDRAIADFSEAARLTPSFAGAYFSRGTAWQFKGDYQRAITDYNEAVRVDPQFAGAYYNRAWIWATCPDARFRDGRKAIESATRACELSGWKDPAFLDALAAAHAEMGDFAAAVKRQTEATDLAPAHQRADFGSRLDLYRAGKPYRAEPKRGT